ncbi:helix-turn-helix domain-containing protein [Brucella pituitosa]|uniref:Helix-turn-helix domain-containing protein n=1 Tax=Brucella pituitosa TaxID=571256 RepID=A0A643EYP5_9HYPH|nr:helix-turn-helix domain-containing protein [Brucella pituitosa]KAB0570592.1 helix-turn-helix domain-containing protein [Brucella pituitosa]
MKRKYDVAAWKQVHFLRLALRHPETTKADCAVLGEIVQRYHGEYGNAWSSHEMLIEDTGISRPSVIRAKKKLERLGFVSVLSMGRRGRSTVYKPNFDMVPEKGDIPVTETKGIRDDTELDALGIKDDTETALLGVTPDTPSYIRLRPTKAGRQDIDIDIAPASPPLTDGLEATVAERAIDGFDELYKAYGYRRGRAEARKAYEALSPAAADHPVLIESANAWREAWERQNKPDAPRYTLANWLGQERHLEDAPSGFVKPERKQQQKQRKLRMNASQIDYERVHEVMGAFVEKENGRTYLKLDTVYDGNASEEVFVVLESSRASEQDAGQKDLWKLLSACGLDSLQDENDLVGRSFKMNRDGEFLTIN